MPQDSTASTWMDRLSDAVGAVIPGGSQLSPRHPIRVSVVMGLCGLASGWFAVLISKLANEAFFGAKDFEGTAFLSARLTYGIVVLIPWIVWSRRSGWWILLLVPYAFVVQLSLIRLILEQFQTSGNLTFFLWGFAWAASLGGLGMFLQRRRWFIWAFAMALFTGCFYFGTIASIESIDSILTSLLPPGELRMLTLLGWLFSAWNAFTAVWMGCLLWDHWPRLVWIPYERQSEQDSERPELDTDIGENL